MGEYLLNKLRAKLTQKQNNGELVITKEEIEEVISGKEMPKGLQTIEELNEVLETKTKDFFPKTGV